ncbi:MAG TPA: DUF1003 domain-containing protein [Mucilaginibacter sp.]|jgi:uncharacterized membrane protein|nr:DUF1003 domain-containing protein [Mucilaginibacter sp.]
MDPKKPLSIQECIKKRKEILNLSSKDKIKKSTLDKIAVWITNHVGSMGFFIIVFSWTVIWLGWNMFAPKEARFDPYPAFVLWLFISNMIQLFLMPLIMVGQNVQSVRADLREEEDLKINLQAELEIETILTHLEYQNDIMMKILKRLDEKAGA